MSQADLAEVWARSLEELSDLQIEPHQRAWLRLTRPLGLVENTALIATPNEFVKEQLETRLRGLITHALSREFGRSIQLAVTVDPATAAGGMPTSRDAAPPHAPGGGCRIHRHRQLDAAAELAGQRVGDQAAKAGLELFLDELVWGGDEGGVLDQAERSGQPQPGTLMGLDLEIGEFLEGPRPDLRQVCLAHWVFTLRPQLQINSLIHRLCTPHSAPCPGRRWTALAGPRRPFRAAWPVIHSLSSPAAFRSANGRSCPRL